MSRRTILILACVGALVVLAPPALILFGRWQFESPRDRENREALRAPALPIARTGSGAEALVPAGDGEGEIRKFRQGELFRCLAVSPDGRTVAAGAAGGNVHRFSLDGSSASSNGGGWGAVNAMTYAPDGNRLLFAPTGMMIMWDLAVGNFHHFSGPMPNVTTCIAFSPSGKTAASGADDRAVRVWNLETLLMIGIMGQHDSRIIALGFAPDARTLYSASDDGDVRSWNYAEGTHVFGRRHGDVRFRCGAFSGDGRYFLAGTIDTDALLYRMDDMGNLAHRLRTPNRVDGVAFSADSTRCVTASGVEVTLWDTASGRRLATLRLPQQYVTGALAVLPTNRHVVYAGNGVSLAGMPVQDEEPAKR